MIDALCPASITQLGTMRTPLFLLVAGVLASCAPGVLIVDKNYQIDQPISVNVGEEMIVIQLSYKMLGGSDFMESKSSDIYSAANLTYAGRSESTINVVYREFNNGEL